MELWSDDAGTRRKAEAARNSRLAERRKAIKEDRVAPPPKRDTSEIYDERAVRMKITRPAKEAERVHIVLIDNSGSNAIIAKHLRESSGYLLGVLGIIDAPSQVAFIYFSDHCDGPALISQEVDYVSPDPDGDKTLHSSIRHVRPACGGDAPEAIECALWDACELDFGHVQERHLYLVTDVVAHEMGLTPDHGCPHQRNWQDSLKRVQETFSSFQVVGCGSDPYVGELQKQFLVPERVALDLIDLSSIEDHHHRTGITGNAILFLIARHRGMQAVESFLMSLYEKWLSEPIFGANTDIGAREAIQRFGKYLDLPKDQVTGLMKRIFG